MWRMEIPSQHVLERSSVQIIINDDDEDYEKSGYIEARFTVGLPARGRNIEGLWACKILTENIPFLAYNSFVWSRIDESQAVKHIESIEDQEFLRNSLDEQNLVAFVINDAILPRKGGHSDFPEEAASTRLFQSPEEMVVEFTLPNRGKIYGMGLQKGINLIIGGGFHGKSTLLSALKFGIYNHIIGDGREFVCCNATAIKIRAEDGRSITNLNLSPFINNLPLQKSTINFSTSNASGSTSQAANIVEAVELGCQLLLLDEDTCANNFMSRDSIMTQLVSAEKEPITTYLERVRELYDSYNVSSILVIGGCGAYFGVADRVVMMESYQAIDVTQSALQIYASAGQAASASASAAASIMPPPPSSSSLHFENIFATTRAIDVQSLAVPGNNAGKTYIKVFDKEKIQYGSENDVIDLFAVEQIVEIGQTRAICEIFQYLSSEFDRRDGKSSLSSSSLSSSSSSVPSLRSLLEALDSKLDEKGWEVIEQFGCGKKALSGNLCRPRRYEIGAAINRWRKLHVWK